MQLHRAGMAPADLQRVRDAYLLAMQLYSGLYTGSGKTTLAHEVGTASLVHRHGGSADLITAGMLHGAYVVGDWGHYRFRLTTAKRVLLRGVIGERAETYVYEYIRQPWSSEAIAGLAARADALHPLERDVIFLHLADELDRLLDFGAILCFRRAEAMQAWMRAQRNHLCRLAEAVAGSRFAAELGEAIDATLAAELPPELMGLRFPGDRDFRIIPPSYRKRLGVRLYQRVAGYARRVERGVRRWMMAATATPEGGSGGRRP